MTGLAKEVALEPLAQPTESAKGDADYMLKLVEQARTLGRPPSARLAYAATRKSYDLLAGMLEKRGLVFKGGPRVKIAAVFYNQDFSWAHECVAGGLVGSVWDQTHELTDDEWDLRRIRTSLKAMGSPLVQQPHQVREPDACWVPGQRISSGHLCPTVVLETSEQNESLEELEAEGDAWMNTPGIQAVILVKIHYEERPAKDLPEITMIVRQKLGKVSVRRAIGRGSSCTARNLKEYAARIPWINFFGEGNPMPPKARDGSFVLDMFNTRRLLKVAYQGLRRADELRAAAATPAADAADAAEASAASLKAAVPLQADPNATAAAASSGNTSCAADSSKERRLA